MKENYRKLFGDYKEIYIGCSKDKEIIRKGASGGVVTSLLIDALKKKIINAAIVVGMNKQKPWLPEVKLAGTKEEILDAAGSKYALIPLSEILSIIEKNKKKNLAVVGLPCHIMALRKMQEQGKFKNIKFIIGLFCGYDMPFKATEFLLKKLKIKKESVKELKYRGGKYPGGFLVKLKNNEQKFLPKYYYDFVNLMFVPDTCLNCMDYMNEKADISVGDAWGHNNHSLILIRTDLGKKIVKSKAIKTSPIAEDEVLKMHWHNIKHKKYGDSIALKVIRNLLRVFGKVIPFRILGLLAGFRRKIKRK